MKRALYTGIRVAVIGPVIWTTANLSSFLHANRATASMAMLLEVLGVAALGDRVLAVSASFLASLAIEWFYFDDLNRLLIANRDAWITFAALLTTALGGSWLALRAQRRADEANRRGLEMELLKRFGEALLTRNTVMESAECAVHGIVQLFGAAGAAIRWEESERAAEAGVCDDQVDVFRIPLDRASLTLFHAPAGPELRSALGHLAGLALDRARGLEKTARMEGERRTEELRGMVLNGLAHNFRTPLTSIKAAASALCADTRLPEGPLKELVRVIDEEADRLDRLLAESLKFARIESHRVNPRMETCSLAEIFSRAFARIVSHLRGHELAVEIPEGLPPLQGDRFLLEQMLFEVLDNSWKYSKPGSPIDIEAVFQGGNVILTVLTLGDEISVNERELIFAKFYRGAVHRSQVEGTGVGLSVARAIAEAHCGNIRLDTEPGGNAFRITLPAGK